MDTPQPPLQPRVGLQLFLELFFGAREHLRWEVR